MVCFRASNWHRAECEFFGGTLHVERMTTTPRRKLGLSLYCMPEGAKGARKSTLEAFTYFRQGGLTASSYCHAVLLCRSSFFSSTDLHGNLWCSSGSQKPCFPVYVFLLNVQVWEYSCSKSEWLTCIMCLSCWACLYLTCMLALTPCCPSDFNNPTDLGFKHPFMYSL